MPFRDKEYEDLRRDCETFPAYTDYLYGNDERDSVFLEPGLHPSIFPTETMQQTQAGVHMPSENHGFPVAAPALPKTDNNTRAVDHRSAPATCNPPEQIVEAQNRSGRAASALLVATNVRREHPSSTAALTSQKQVNAANAQQSPSPARVVTPQGQLRTTPRQRTGSSGQARAPFLLYSSPGTEVTIATTNAHKLQSELTPSQSPSRAPNVPARHLGRPPTFSLLEEPMVQQYNQLPSNTPQSAQVPLIRPGELLHVPHYFCIPEERRRIGDQQISGLWRAAQESPNEQVRQQAQATLLAVSAKIHEGVSLIREGQWSYGGLPQQAMQSQLAPMTPSAPFATQHPFSSFGLQQSSQFMGSQAMAMAMPQGLPHFYQDNVQSTYQQPMQMPLGQGTPFGPGSQPQQFSDPQQNNTGGLSTRAYMLNAQTHGLQAQSHAELQGRQQRQPAASRQAPQLHPSAPTFQQEQQPTVPAFSHLQQSVSTFTQQAPQAPPAVIPPNIRAYVDANVPGLLAAYRMLMTPCEAPSVEVLARRQQAQMWFDGFKASLPPAGHAYLDEVFEKMLAQVGGQGGDGGEQE